MMNDQNAVRGEVYVELEAIGARGESSIEGGQRVFGAKGASAPMGEDQGARGIEERHTRKCSWQRAAGRLGLIDP